VPDFRSIAIKALKIHDLLANRTPFSERCARHASHMLLGFPQARTDIRQLAERLSSSTLAPTAAEDAQYSRASAVGIDDGHSQQVV
jgi:hypothetical protein